MEIPLRSSRGFGRFFLPLSLVHRDCAGFGAHIETHAATGAAMARVHHPHITQFVECPVRVGYQTCRGTGFHTALAGLAQIGHDFDTGHTVVRHGTSIVRRHGTSREPAMIFHLSRERHAPRAEHFNISISTTIFQSDKLVCNLVMIGDYRKYNKIQKTTEVVLTVPPW
jgi:hypothetical protein